jgi:molybdopterin converting factor small subunit
MARPRSSQITVRLPSPWRELAGGQRAVPVRGQTVAEGLSHLVARHPALRPRLRDETGQLRPSVLVFLNSQDIRSHQGEATPLRPGDEIAVLPALEGG